MIILSIETSCDETAVSIVRATGDFPHATYEVLGNALFSQIDIHREFGGVFPAVAKREHAKTLVPMLERALEESKLEYHPSSLSESKTALLEEILYREPGLTEALLTFLGKQGTPAIDLIAVTSGPGLEPALWVGINFAKALAVAWDISLAPINHMEGHIFSSLFDGERFGPLKFPALALLISGGHTELVLMRDWCQYELVGQTRDDAVGEAFDKVARTLGLPYPGGPEVSKLAEAGRSDGLVPSLTLPRPMLATESCDFSFSGIKTAVLTAVKKAEEQGVPLEKTAPEVALDFENAVTEVLIAKTKRAMDLHDVQTVILGGGVSANTNIRRAFRELFETEYQDRALYLPEPKFTTDNAVMIALAAHARFSVLKEDAVDETRSFRADGNLSLHS